MYKWKFYSLYRGEDGKDEAILVKGYTDGNFNYYFKDNGWFAIEPLTGRAVFMAATRKNVIEGANRDYERIQKILRDRTDWIDYFRKLVNEAESKNVSNP